MCTKTQSKLCNNDDCEICFNRSWKQIYSAYNRYTIHKEYRDTFNINYKNFFKSFFIMV
jgi:hypothetical protein